jgi:hypothetical protein
MKKKPGYGIASVEVKLGELDIASVRKVLEDIIRFRYAHDNKMDAMIDLIRVNGVAVVFRAHHERAELVAKKLMDRGVSVCLHREASQVI